MAEVTNTTEHALNETTVHGESSHESAHGGIHVALSAERLGEFASIPITNTLVTSWIVVAILIAIAFFAGRKVSLIPGRFQTALEGGFGFFYDYIENTLGSRELARRFFPLLATTFLFIWVANSLGLVPGIGSITYTGTEGTSALFRGVNADLNMTLALTLIAVFVIEFSGIIALGFFKYFNKFFTLKSPVAFVVGLIEFVSELSRIVSFSFRLYGNIFAGKVLIAVVGFFVPYILPVPIMAFELFVSLVQAGIFTLLMLFFIKMAITPHDEAH